MQNMKNLIWIITIALAAMLIGVGVSYYLSQAKQNQNAQNGAAVFPQPRTLHAVKLVDGKGQPFTNKQFENHWSLVFFGFTHCPVICPTTMSILNQAYTKLKNDKFKPLPQVIFVSVDPERDDANRANQYASGFNPDFIGITGDKTQIDQLARDMNAVYMKVEIKPTNPNEKPTYTIDHSTAIMLVDPQGKLRAIFSSPENGDKFAQVYQDVLKQIK